MVETGLIERLVGRAVDEKLQRFEHHLWAQHWLLTELVRQLPRPALLSTAQRLDQMRAQLPEQQREAMRDVHEQWHQYLCQQAALVEGDTPPGFHPGQPVPPRPKPAL